MDNPTGPIKMKEYDKIKRLGHEENQGIFAEGDKEICIQEKVDGANFRFMIKDGKIIFGSRTRQLTSNEGEDTNVEKNFKRAIEYIRDKLKDKNLEECEGLMFFGENMVKHTMNYDWEKIPPYLGFDIYDIEGEEYFHWDNAKKIFNELGLEFVPIIKVCKASEITEVNDEMVPQSKYFAPGNKDTKAEGIVFKRHNPRIYAKYVRDVFKERNAEAFGGSPKYNKIDDTNNADLVHKYCTNARIEKHIFKLIDEGYKLDMPLMQYLPNRVYDDIMEEEWREIVFSKWKIDFGKLKKPLTKRCLAVLKQVITNNALQ